MEEARSSWNTLYQSREGFECQITLRDQDEADLIRRSGRMMKAIVESEGLPLRRKSYIPGESFNPPNNRENEGANNSQSSADNGEKTYLDEQGVRRCNQRLQNNEVCGAKVNWRDGKYGPFWACSNYRQHA